jgi:hypothetical protein
MARALLLLGVMRVNARIFVFCSALGCLLFVTGCDEQSPLGPTVPLSQRFSLAPGETASVQDTTVRVQFLRVSGDSRCPADALCIQGGDAIVHVRVTDAALSSDYDLHTGGPPQFVVSPTGFRVELAELQPYPFSSRTIQPGDYRATLVVAR